MTLSEYKITYTPQKELQDRISKFQEKLLNNNIDGALIIQKADLFYFSGTAQNAHLFIPVQGEPVLMVKKSLRRARDESSLTKIVSMKSLKESLKEIVNYLNGKGKIGLEMDVLPASLYFKYEKALKPLEVVDISTLVREVRTIKSTYEINRLKEAAKLNHLMFSQIPQILKEGMTEVEFAGELEAIYRKNGHQGTIRMRGFNQDLYYGHLMSGWNLAYPSFFDGPTGGTGLNPSYPQSAGYKKINKNEPVMVDYVGVYNGYMVDQARIFSIGELPSKLVEAYQTALKIKAEIIEHTKPGISGKDLFEMAHHIASNTGFQNYFLGYEDRISFIGHGVGIELDEWPVIAKNLDIVLKPGMVFALEPKFIFPDLGAVGIEDTFVITEDGLQQITFFDESIQII